MQTLNFTLHSLLHAADLVEGYLRRRLVELDLPPRQARVIDALGRMGSASQIALAREMDVTPASMSTMTTRLIGAGLVFREVDPDEARSNLLRLTARGRRLLADIYTAWADVDQMLVDTLGRAKSEQLAALTRELRDTLGGHVPGTPSDQPDPHTRTGA